MDAKRITGVTLTGNGVLGKWWLKAGVCLSCTCKLYNTLAQASVFGVGAGALAQGCLGSSASSLRKAGTVVWCSLFLELVPIVNVLFCCP